MKRILESEPFEIHMAANLREAMELFLSKAFDLVLLDAGLQKIKKFDIAKWFTYHCSTARVALMADKQDSTIDPAARASDSVARIIRRPIDPVRLIAILKQVLADSGFSGTIHKIELQDYIQMVCLSCLDKSILVYHGAESGRIDIRAGRIVHAALPDLKGEEAFYRILAWSNGRFKDIPPNGAAAVSIQKDYRQLLMEAAKYRDESPQTETGTEESLKMPVEISKKVNAVMGPPIHDIHELKEIVKRPATPETGLGLKPAAKTAIKNLKIISERKGRFGRYALIMGGLIVLLSVTVIFWLSRGSKTGSDSSAASAVRSTVQTSEPKGAEVGRQTAPGSVLPGFMGYGALPRQVLLKIHGSNTIGAELVPALAKAFLRERLKAGDVIQMKPSGTSTLQMAGVVNDQLSIIEIEALGSATGFKDLLAEKCDIAMSSRPIKKEELLLLAQFGDMTAVSSEHVLGMDGIAVIVHPANPVQQLNIKQAAEIFSGKITDWRALNGKAGPIHIYSRDENSGTYDTFKSIVIPKEELASGSQRFDSNSALSDAVAKDPDGIGFVGLPYVRNNKALAIADTGAADLFPNFFTVATEDYSLARRLFLYVRANSENPYMRDFIEFALSFKGQEVVAQTGFVDMNIRCFPSNPELKSVLRDPNVRKQYANLIQEGKRLSTNFRFHPADARLDNRGVKDLERLVEFLKNNLDKKIVLVGFTDSAGDYEFNQKLALERAKSVGKELSARGLVVAEVIGVGQERNIASNETESGRAKNRRVEVWIY